MAGFKEKRDFNGVYYHSPFSKAVVFLDERSHGEQLYSQIYTHFEVDNPNHTSYLVLSLSW